MSNRSILRYFLIVLMGLILGSVVLYKSIPNPSSPGNSSPEAFSDEPLLNNLPESAEKRLLIYGRELIINTAAYLGPHGSVASITNGMNCGNCHLEAGMRSNANAYIKVAATYPKFKPRSGRVESVTFRVNDCLQRSLNGQTLDTVSREMTAILAYIKWTARLSRPDHGEIYPGTPELPVLARAASVINGKEVFRTNCVVCHGNNGQGQLLAGAIGYKYPPLWGDKSYNVSAGMYRLSKLAGFVKYNMPYTEKQGAPILTDEQAWDVASFVNSQPRGNKRFGSDRPEMAAKPYDYPFGPYADAYSEERHKYGPYGDIKKK